jgi:hypothetical protein
VSQVKYAQSHNRKIETPAKPTREKLTLRNEAFLSLVDERHKPSPERDMRRSAGGRERSAQSSHGGNAARIYSV